MTAAPISDTIVAVSTAWGASPVGVIRVTGPDSHRLVASLCPRARFVNASRPTRLTTRLEIPDPAGPLDAPAEVLLFRAPRSYTGQDVAEIHTLGAPPLLRLICEGLIAAGARRALPGEFTSRAWLNGRMPSEAVVAVQGLLAAETETQAREAARLAHGGRRQAVDDIAGALLDLLALIEAGIDFTDEEDVRLIEPAAALARIDLVLTRLDGARNAEAMITRGRPRVALAGLPNAGKSTLFNALIGAQRAIVSPVIGATRDVVSADAQVAGIDITLQDCAGLGHTPGEVELAAHRAAEAAAELADLVLWAHDASRAWGAAERAARDRIPADRLLIAHTKTDLVEGARAARGELWVCAQTGRGLDQLRIVVAERLSRQAAGQPGILDLELAPTRKLLDDAKKILENSAGDPAWPELVSIALRESLESLTSVSGRAHTEAILGRIYAHFCVGK